MQHHVAMASAVSKTKRWRRRRHQNLNMVEVTVRVESRAINYYRIMESTITVIISSLPLLSAVVDSFRFGAVWILSTRRLSDVCVVFHCCGFFPLQSRVDSFHSAAQCCPRCLAMLWILSTSEPCGFFPLGDSVVSVLFRDDVDSFVSTSLSSSSSSSS